MTDLKIGAHINKSSQGEDIDLSTPQTIPDVEPTQPVEDTPPVEPVNEDVPVDQPQEPIEPSSLTPDVEPTQPVEDQGKVFEESEVFSFLSEKLGREISSIEDLNQVPEENPLENDSYLKGLYEWRKKTNRPLEDFVKYQKDYSKLSDLEVAREALQHEYPNFTPEEIDAEMRDFQPSDDDLDDEASAKIRNLKKYATKGRTVLEGLKSNLESPLEGNFSPEIKEDLLIAKRYKESVANNQVAVKEYQQNIKATSQSLEGLKLNLSDELTIDFKVSPETKNQIPEMIDQMPHWKNQDGSWNHQAIVEDAIKIKHHGDMIKLAYEQGLNAGADKVVKDSNNITLSQPKPMDNQSLGKKGVEIEGIDDFIKGSSLKIGR